MENKQRPVIAETRELVQKYHVLEKAQIYAYFALDGRDHFVGKAFKALEKERQVFIHPELEVVAASEEAIAAKDLGTMKAVWVLVDVMKKKQVEEHFPASKEEYPVRIVFYGEGEIFDILYISEEEVIVVENPDYISAIHIADVIGYCVVKEGGEVEYYQYSQGGSEE